MNQTKKKFQLGETLVPGIALLFGMAYFFQTREASLDVMRWPYIILALLIPLWLGVGGMYLYSRADTEERGAFNSQKWAVPTLMVVAPLIYLLAMPYLGFALSTLIFLSILFRLLGSHSWGLNLSIAFIMTLVLHLALIVLMHMSLPRLEIGGFIL